MEVEVEVPPVPPLEIPTEVAHEEKVDDVMEVEVKGGTSVEQSTPALDEVPTREAEREQTKLTRG